MASIRVEGRWGDTIDLQDADGQFSARPPVPFEARSLGLVGLRQSQLEPIGQDVLEARVVPLPGTRVSDLNRAACDGRARELAGCAHAQGPSDR